MTLFPKEYRGNQSKIRSYWIRVGPNPVIGAFLREGCLDPDTQERRPCNNRGRDWSGAAASQATARSTSYHQRLERGEEGFVPKAWRGSVAIILYFQPPELRKEISIV